MMGQTLIFLVIFISWMPISTNAYYNKLEWSYCTPSDSILNYVDVIQHKIEPMVSKDYIILYLKKSV